MSADGIRIGLLEYLGAGVDGAPREKRELAFDSVVRAADSGYHRVWAAEHHGRPALCSSPLPTCAGLGGAVPGVRVGTATTLLRIRNTYLTAADIHETIFFCRSGLDIGLGRGDVTPAVRAAVPGLGMDDAQLADQITALVETLRHGDQHLPPLSGDYQLWLHGSGTGSAELAGKLGANYCHALFFNPDLARCRAAYERYRACGGTGTVAVALAVAADGSGGTDEMTPTRRGGWFVYPARDVAGCARAAQRALTLTGADELVIADMSGSREQHLAVITGMRPSLAELEW